MKFKIFSMLLVLGMLSVMPLIYMGKLDPMAMLSGDFSMDGGDAIAKLKAQAPKNLTNVTTDKKIQMYKWRDEHGVMQFSNTPPPHMQDAEQIELNPNKNVIQATKVPVVEKKEASMGSGEINNPYSVGGMKKAIEDARGVQEMLNKRAENQQKMMEKY